MDKNKIYLKLILTNLAIIIVDVICFSPAFIGLSFDSESALISALSVTLVVVSILLFVYLNYRILNSENLKHDYNIEKASGNDDYISILRKFINISFYQKEVGTLIDQIERFERKEDKFNNILYQKFQDDEENKNLFLDVSKEAHTIFIKNVKKLVNLFSIFDEEEYKEFLIKYGSIPKEKQELYNENLNDVREIIKSNENILLNVDKLINETTRFGDSVESTKLDEKSLNKLKDITNSMKELRTSEDL